ncbi:MAG: dTDP-4-amino-4,6-dideoxygalactose transaminase [Eubacteriaceae bacterium]
MKIRFTEPYITGDEEIYIKDVLKRGRLAGDGFYTKEVNKFIQDRFNTPKALMMTSGSTALDAALIILDIQEGDEVILPSFTFVSTANSVILRGAKCIFVEVDEFLNLDLDAVENKITEKTKLVMPVHYASTSCDMDRLMELSEKYGYFVVEDAAQAVNAKYKDRFLGTIGHIGCYSFHETKNITCGEGGALLINTEDKLLQERAEIVREKGTNRSKFFRGEIDKYSWVDMGSSYLPSDILSAFLLAQFNHLDEIQELRKEPYLYYQKNLKHLEEKGVLQLPKTPDYNQINYHIFYLLLNTEEERNQLMDYLKDNGINAVFHYLPLHDSTKGHSLGYKNGDLPFTESISSRLLRLPLYSGLSIEETKFIVNKINRYFGL